MNTHQSSPPESKSYYFVDEDQLRDLILKLSPDIRHDTDRMADLIRELVTLEREKTGLDNPKGTLELVPNKDKKTAAHPDLIGSGRVTGRFYHAAAWVSGSKIKIALLPQKTK